MCWLGRHQKEPLKMYQYLRSRVCHRIEHHVVYCDAERHRQAGAGRLDKGAVHRAQGKLRRLGGYFLRRLHTTSSYEDQTTRATLA